jgi:hypothetical protein
VPEILSQPSITDWPREFQSNLEYRSRLLDACEVDMELRAYVIKMCKIDILFWLDIFAWTKDPRQANDILPFICYDYQRTTIKDIERHIDEGKDLLIEKSRDMGVSWMILYVYMHKWLFEPGSDFRVGSRKEDFVDKINDIDTLIEKVRFNINRMPQWLLPKGFNPNEHLAYMRIINPENGNAIIGESANAYFASGGRRKSILIDEFPKWDDAIADAAWTATADASPCRIVASTPVGSGNKFADLALGTHERIDKITLHWTLHPDKSKNAYYIEDGRQIPVHDSITAFNMWKSGVRVRSPWYDAECERRSEQDIAQELDIDYLKSGSPFFNIQAINGQKVWEHIERKGPFDAIPFGRFIKVHLVNIDNKIEVRESKEGWLRIFELPSSGRQYVVSADTSEGLAKHDEAFGVIRDKWTRNVVACSNGHYAPDDWAVKLFYMAKFFNDADNVPENNNHGYSVCSDLKQMDTRLYYTKDKDGNSTTRAGFTTDARTRPLMLDQLEEEIRKNVFEMRDEVLISQAKTFVYNQKNGKPEADGKCLDDGVIALAIGSYTIKESPYKPKAETDSRTKSMAQEYKKVPMFRH